MWTLDASRNVDRSRNFRIQEPAMSEDPTRNIAANTESPRAAYQVLAEKVGAVQPNASISEELFNFAEAVAKLTLEKQASRGNQAA
jgi:hypothetical protein